MGVRLLQTFIAQYVRNGILPVDIKREVEEYKRQNNGAEPLIVIDLLSLHSLFYTNAHELILGGRYNLYNDRILDLIGRIKSLGVRLVFFTDGPTRAEKIATCLKRRNDNYYKALDALGAVYSGVDLSSSLRNDYLMGRTPFFSALRKLAQQFGEMYTSKINECDLEIANYATRNGALAIISQDTDFLIFEGDWRYWSSNDLNVWNLCTSEFNRKALRETLGLKSDQMPILATMSGNDFVPYDSVRNFHRRIKRNNRFHFGAIANQIKSSRLSVRTISDEDIRYIAQLIFNKPEQDSGVELIEWSLKSYDYTQMNTESDVILPIPYDDVDKFSYVILANIKYTVQLDHFDLAKKDFMPFYDMITPLIRRIMGILLKHDTTGLSTRSFYFKLHPDSEFEEVILEPAYPLDDVPPVKNLLCDKVERGSALYNTRMRLLSWLLSTNLTAEIVRLPLTNLLNAATLLYLIQLQQISTDEADCLLLACNCPGELRDSLKLDDMKRINERDARLAFLFVSIRVFIKRCFKTVGLKELCSFITFDGLYFHTLRKQWATIDKDKLLRPYTDVRIYAK